MSARLKSSVRMVERDGGLLVTDTAALAPGLRLSLIARPLVAAMATGLNDTQASALSEVQRRCIAELRRYGLLEGSAPDPAITQKMSLGVRYLGNPDRLAAGVASVLGHIPSRVLAALALGLGAAALICAGLLYAAWLTGAAPLQLSWVGAVAYFLLIQPLHEFSHAVACRAAGVPVSGIGVAFRGRLLPSLFTNTKNLVLVPSALQRVWVPLAGPCFELLALGGLSAASLWLPLSASVRGAVDTVHLLTLYFFLFNLNPFRPSDASQALAEILQVLPAQRAQRLSRTYRAAYAVLFAAAMTAAACAIAAVAAPSLREHVAGATPPAEPRAWC